MTLTAPAIATLEHAVQQLTRADAGLQQRDRTFLQRLATIPPEAWGPGPTRAAFDVLAGAGAQALADCGIDVAAITAPAEATASRQVRALWHAGGELVLAFSFDETVHAAVRALPERHYDQRTKQWTVPPTPATAADLAALAAQHTFTITAEAATLLQRALAGEACGPERRIERVDGRWRITLPKPSSPADWQLLADVRALPGRRFHPETAQAAAYWTLEETAEGLAALCDLIDVHAGRLHLSPSDQALLGADRAQALAETAHVTLGDDGFLLQFPYDAGLVAQVQAIHGRSFDRERKSWTIPRNLRSGLQLAALLANTGLSISDDAAAELHRLRLDADRRAEQQLHLVELSQALSATVDLQGFGRSTYPFQDAGILYAVTARGALLADSQGLGKTIQALGAIHLDQAFPALIVCPATLKLTWRDEAQAALPGRHICVLDGKEPERARLADADVAIINYDVLADWAKELRRVPWKALVGDEGHKLKEHAKKKDGKLRGPARSYAFQQFARAVHKREGLVLLPTATPLVNRPRDLVNELRIIGKLEEFGGAQAFHQRFCGPEQNDHGTVYNGASNLEELNVRLRATCMVRRHKNDVLPDLPPKQRALVRLELPERDMRRYAKASADIVAFLREHRADQARLSLLDDGVDAEQAEHLAVAEGGRAAAAAAEAPALVRLNTLRELVAKAKAPLVIDWTRTFLESGEKLILFAKHRSVQRALLDAFPGCARIIADDSPTAVEHHKHRFQTSADCRLIICSIDAAAEGHTLTAASNVAFAELDWTARALDQAEDRCYGRLNDAHGATCWYLLADETIDFTMAQLIEAKRSMAARAIDGAEGDRFVGQSILDDVIAALAAR